NKVSKKMYWISTILVAFGSHLSGLWIIIANSFMQTPAGFEMVNGVAVMTNFFEAAINHSTLERYTHTIASAWLTGSLFSAGIGAWYLLKEKHVEIAKKIVHISLIVFIISGILQLFLGHAHAVQVAKTQPVKLAAFESQWETKNGASLSLFAIPDVENEKNYFEIGIPKLLSILVYFDPDAKVQGLKDFPKDERPPVFLVFAFYHIMIGLGTMFFFAAFLTIFMLWKGKVWSSKWFLKGLLFSIPLPHIATQTGWAAAEVGRQPWVVYNVLKTSDAVSKVVSAGEILFTLILLFATYSLIFYVFMRILLKIIKKGPEEISDSGY
ncbi:MAG: cytochrome ubiquinol oxidase subunit I, partial [Calditrichia bacterium]|nr:cytochrome ubiquinol oxidase subunit I [Calditrichia bacterium]